MSHKNKDSNLYRFLTPLLPTRLLGYIVTIEQRSGHFMSPYEAKQITDEIALFFGSHKQPQCKQFCFEFLVKIAQYRSTESVSLSFGTNNSDSNKKIAELFIEHCLEQASIPIQKPENCERSFLHPNEQPKKVH